LLRQEEEYIEQICAQVSNKQYPYIYLIWYLCSIISILQIVAFHPDIVITEKGVSDLAQHYLLKANITTFRRLRKTDNNRVARATGATIVNRPDEIQETDIGTGCGLFEVRKIGDE
jgi:T-complex protein 1 subunit gamma